MPSHPERVRRHYQDTLSPFERVIERLLAPTYPREGHGTTVTVIPPRRYAEDTFVERAPSLNRADYATCYDALRAGVPLKLIDEWQLPLTERERRERELFAFSGYKTPPLGCRIRE